MHLRDRSTLRAPGRYKGEVIESPLTGLSAATPSTATTVRGNTPSDTTPAPPAARPPRRVIMPASARPAFPPPYTDYDSTLPPAAFPTLGVLLSTQEAERRVAANLARRDYDSDRTVGQSDDEHTNGGDDALNNVAEGGCDPASSDSYDENVVAMESSDEESYHDMPAVDAVPEVCIPADPKWTDVTSILRVQILSAMVPTQGWTEAASALQLTQKERKEAVGFLDRCNAQIAQENKQLKEMQEKQLRALLRIDNSALKSMRVPAQLVFRNTAKPYIRNPKNRWNPDYFMSKASEVLTARRFLRQRGLDPDFAGKWSNGFALIRLDDSHPDEEKLEWALDENAEVVVEQDTVSQLEFQRPPTLGERSHNNAGPDKDGDEGKDEDNAVNDKILRTSQKISFINSLGGANRRSTGSHPLSSSVPDGSNVAREILRRRARMRRRLPTQVRRAVATASNSSPRSERKTPLMRLRIGPEGAAKIDGGFFAQLEPQRPAPCALPTGYLPLVSSPLKSIEAPPPELPSLDSNDVFSYASNEAIPRSSPPLPDNPTNVPRQHALPAKRKLSGAWWYHSGEIEDSQSARSKRSRRSGPASTPSRNLKDRLLAVRAEAQMERARANGQESGTPGTLKAIVNTSLPLRTMARESGNPASLDANFDNMRIDTPTPDFTRAILAAANSALAALQEAEPSAAVVDQIPIAVPEPSTQNTMQTQRTEYPELSAPVYSPITPLVLSSCIGGLNSMLEEENGSDLDAPYEMDSPKPITESRPDEADLSIIDTVMEVEAPTIQAEQVTDMQQSGTGEGHAPSHEGESKAAEEINQTKEPVTCPPTDAVLPTATPDIVEVNVGSLIHETEEDLRCRSGNSECDNAETGVDDPKEINCAQTTQKRLQTHLLTEAALEKIDIGEPEEHVAEVRDNTNNEEEIIAADIAAMTETGSKPCQDRVLEQEAPQQTPAPTMGTGGPSTIEPLSTSTKKNAKGKTAGTGRGRGRPKGSKNRKTIPAKRPASPEAKPPTPTKPATKKTRTTARQVKEETEAKPHAPVRRRSERISGGVKNK